MALYPNKGGTSVIRICPFRTPEFVVFSVEDTGIGIAKEDQEKIFEQSSRFHEEIRGNRNGFVYHQEGDRN